VITNVYLPEKTGANATLNAFSTHYGVRNHLFCMQVPNLNWLTALSSSRHFTSTLFTVILVIVVNISLPAATQHQGFGYPYLVTCNRTGRKEKTRRRLLSILVLGQAN
jgi:hypothetical protein